MKMECLKLQVLGESHTLQGRNIEPQRAKARGSGGSSYSGGGGSYGGSRDQEPVKKLFVSGIDDELSESDIQDYFSGFGKVSCVLTDLVGATLVGCIPCDETISSVLMTD